MPMHRNIYKIIFTVRVVNVTQCNVMLTNTAVEHMLCIQKHQYERYLTHKVVMGDTCTLQELVKASNELKLSQR